MTKKRTEGEEEQVEDGSSFSDPASCCGPMIERMMKAFADSADEREGSSAAATGSRGVASCRTMMQQMMERCGRSRSAENRPTADSEETHPCC
jgi:hypothetical protein